jgi:hypothetical protein
MDDSSDNDSSSSSVRGNIPSVEPVQRADPTKTDAVSADVRFNGMMTVVFEAPDSFAVYVPPGYHADHVGPVIVDNLHGTPTLGTIELLYPHPTDDNHLTPDEILDHKNFDTRLTLLHPYSNTFHHSKSLHDIKAAIMRFFVASQRVKLLVMVS